MKFISILLSVMLVSCGNQFECDFNPEEFELSESFSIHSKNVKIDSIDLAHAIEKFGVENEYCVANKSRFQVGSDTYLINIRIVKNNFSLYVRGVEEHIFWLEEKKNLEKLIPEIKSFCDQIEPYMDVEKVRYYEDVDNLCDMN